MRHVIRTTALATALLWTLITPAHAQRVRIPTPQSQDSAADTSGAPSDEPPAGRLWTARAQLVDSPPGPSSPAGPSSPSGPPPTYVPAPPASNNALPPGPPTSTIPDPYLNSGNPPPGPCLTPGSSYQPYPAYPPPGSLLTPQPVLCEYPWQAFGEFLYLQPRNVEIGYAIPIDATGIQNGLTGIVEPGYDAGFSIGFARALTPSSNVGASFTHFESNTPDSIAATGANSISPLVLIPATPEATNPYLSASAYEHLQFSFVDLDYRGIFSTGEHYSLNYVVGARYANLSQVFDSHFLNPGLALNEEAYNNIGFDGGGIRVGLEGQRFSQGSGLMVYAKGYASFVAGRFNGNYAQNDNALGTVAASNWASDRVVPILDVELGVGWTSPGGRVRFTGGYMFSAWYNTILTADFIRAVQQNNPAPGAPSLVNNFNGINDTLTFDGFNVRMEVRF